MARIILKARSISKAPETNEQKADELTQAKVTVQAETFEMEI